MSFTDDFLKGLNKRNVSLGEINTKNVSVDLGSDDFTKSFLSGLEKRKKKKEEEEIAIIKHDLFGGSSDDDDIAPVKDEDDSLLDFFQKGSFEDGYQFGDVTKSILGTAGDIGLNVVKGGASLLEGLVDVADYGIAAGADALGYDDYAERLRKLTATNLVDKFTKPADDYLNQYSVLGRTSDSIAQGIGQVGGIILTGGLGQAAGLGSAGVTALTTGTMGISGMGSGMGEAYQSGATDEEALQYGMIAGAADALSELMFGGLGKAVNATGLSVGLSSADDILAKKVSGLFTNQIAKNIAEGTIKAGAEGLEEVVAGVAQAIGKKLTYMSEEDMGQILKDENLLEQFVVGAFTSGIAQAPSIHSSNKTGTDFITGQTQNEQAVVEKEVEKRIAELEKDGKKLTGKEKSKIQEQVEKDMEKGYISTDTIEETLGGETWVRYKETIDSENALKEKLKATQEEFDTLNKMKQGEMTGEQIDRRADLKLELENLRESVMSAENHSIKGHLKQELSKQVSEMVRSDRLIESYNERARRGQAFKADLTKYDTKQRAVIENAQKSGILNNTNRTHEFVDMVAKIAADKGVLFDFTNNAKLKESGFAVDGKAVNGYVTKDGITVNIQSPKALNSTVGHEITHVLEGTDLYTELQNSVIEYAKTKGEYQQRFDALTKLYENVEGADINAELTADLVGDYLFTDENFINNLSVNHRNVFQKIYDEVKYLVKVATAGSKEARELEKVKRAFDRAYREFGKAQTDAKGGAQYSLNADQQKHFDYNQNRSEVGSTLKTLKGSAIKRSSKYGVGKEIGGEVYVHKQYADEVVPAEVLSQAKRILAESNPDFQYNALKYNPKTGVVAFQEAPDFDTAREPVVGDYVSINTSTGAVKNGHSNYIWHHKWNWVKNDYTGFDVAESWNWSKQWLNTLTEVSDGNGIARWNTQLDRFGLPHDGANSGKIQYSLTPVEPVQPTSAKWARSHTTEEAMEIAAQKGIAMWDVAADYSNEKNPTSMTLAEGGTTQTYRKVYGYLGEGYMGRILDASSGQGYGTRVGRDMGLDVTDIEPYPDPYNYQFVKDKDVGETIVLEQVDKKTGKTKKVKRLVNQNPHHPDYMDYSELDAKVASGEVEPFDFIISNAVLNVLPQDQRDALVRHMGNVLADGGQMFVNVRTAAEIKSLANKEKNAKLGETEAVESSGGSYQYGFTNSEIVEYLKDALGAGFEVVDGRKTFGTSSPTALVTKNGGDAKYSLSSNIDTSGMDEDAKEVIRNLKRETFASKYGIHQFASYTSERIEQEIADSMADGLPDYAHSYIAWVDPEDFVRATTTGQQDYERILDEAGDLDYDRLKGESQPIYLHINTRTNQIVGHEGRHRISALGKAGYDRVAVIVRSNSPNDIGQLLFPEKSMKVKGQVFTNDIARTSKKGVDFWLHNMLPLSEKYADAAKKLFSNTEGSLQYSLSSDSEGRQLSNEQSEYFKDSAVRDKDGNLMVLYHGTQNDFTVFDIGRSGENYEGGWSEYGEGIYLTPDKKTAEYYGDNAGRGREVKLMEVYANIKSLFNVNDPVDFDISDLVQKYELTEFDERHIKRAGDRLINFLQHHNESVRDYLTSKGYDGIWEKGLNGDVYQVVAYSENQIKNTDNAKPTENPDIRYSLTEEEAQETNRKLSGASLHYDAKSGTVYSLSSLEDAFDYNKGEEEYRAAREEYVNALMKATGKTSEEANRYLNGLFLVHDLIAEDRDRLDYEAAVNRTAWVSNAEYGGSIDFSTLCAKRRLFTGTFDAIQMALPDTVLNENDFLKIRDMLLNKGYESPCSMCYVEGSRAKHGVYVDKWLKEYLKTNPEWKPQIADFASTTRLEQTRIQHPEAYAAYKKAMNALSQRKPKEASVRTDYKGEILRDFRNDSTVAEKNKNGGVRFNSFSDFEIIHALDAMQVITDMARVGLNGQAYTKVKEFAEAFGNTGLKINLSLVAKDVDANGRLVMDETNGMNYAEAMDIRNRYSENVGTVIVVFNDAQLKAALADGSIDYVLPFHRSQWKKSQYALMGLPEATRDYTNIQNERYKNPKTGRPKKVPTGNIMPNEYWDFRLSGRENAQKYLDYINENSYIPKFDFLLNRVDGKWTLPEGEIGDGYFKLLIDFKMYDNDGWGSPQRPVLPEFNMPYIQQMLKDYKGGHQSFPVAHDVVNEFVESKKHSLSEEGAEHPVYGDYNVYGSDVALETEVAPVAVSETENTTPVQKTQLPAENTTVSEEEMVAMFPDEIAPDMELERLIQDKNRLESAMQDAFNNGDDQALESIGTEYGEVMERLTALESEIAETEEGRLGSIRDADAPPEMEAPYYEEAEPAQPANPMADRNIEDVGNRKVKAYMYENPEVKPFFQAEARVMLGDLGESIRGEKLYNGQVYYESGGEKGWMGTKRQTTAEIADLLDNYGYTYAQIEKGLNAIIEDNGKENNAVSKRIEFALNDRLRNGYTNVWGEEMPPDQDYIRLLQEKEITEYSQEAFESFMANADQYAPEEIAPVTATAEESTVDEDIAPTYDVTGKKGVPDGQQAFLPDVGVEPKVTRKQLHQNIVDRVKDIFHVRGFEFDDVLKKAKDLSTFATVDNTPQRVMEKALGYKQGQILSDITVNKVAQNETEGIQWLNSFTDRKNGLLAQISKQYNIKPGSKQSAAAQMYAEGFYVGENDEIIAYTDKELAADFPDPKVRNNIRGLANDPRIRKIYDETLAAINESRKRNAYPEIPRLDNYFLHFRAMEDTFSRLGLPFNPNDIRAKDLPTDLNGVTADLKPGQPYFASAMHRTGKRTSFDLLGGLEKYLTSAKNQIYHIDDIQTLRALRNYIAETYGQASGLENLGELSDEEAAQRIEAVYGSHLSTFAKFLNEEANVLAGKTALIDRGLEGIIGRRGITFLDTLNRQVGSNMVGYNISSSLTNFIAPVQALAKSNKADFVKGFAQTAANKVGSIFGRGDSFAEESPVMIRRKGAERFYRTPWQKLSDPGYVLMGAVDDISTELIARAKYNEFTRKGMDSQTAHIETDKWVSRLMGDRSLGQQPQLYNSKMLGIITKFQLEVRNQLDSQFYDTIQEAKVSTEDIQNGLARNAKKAAKITSTFVQLAVAQHLFGKAFESIAGYNPAFDIIEAIIKAFGWDDDEEDEDTVLDNIEQGFFELMGDMPYVSTMTGGRIPLESALPIKELYKGEDQYGNEKSRWETLSEAAPYWLLPGGYGQIKKTRQGLSMFDEDLPIAGSYTDSGKLRFPVEDTLGNRVQAALFGQYASRNARDYFDNERKALGEKQIEEFMDSDLPIRDYWEYREGLSGLEKLSEKTDYIDSLDLPISTKNMLINNIAGREEPIDLTGYGNYSSFEEFDFAKKNPEKYSFLKENGVSVDQYNSFDEDTKDVYSWAFNNPERYQFLRSQGVTLHAYKDFDKETKEAYGWAYENPDSISLAKTVGGIVEYNKIAEGWKDLDAKDEFGNTVSGLKKQRVYDYIYSLDIPEAEKHILFKSRYTSDDSHNYEIVDYLNNRSDISYDEMIEILKKLKFEVDEAGNIYW